MCPCLPVSPHSCIRSVGLVYINSDCSLPSFHVDPDPTFRVDADLDSFNSVPVFKEVLR